MDADKKLHRYEELKDEARSLAEVIEELGHRVTSLRAVVIDGMPRASDGKNHADDAIIMYMDAVKRYAEKQREIAAEMEEIETMIDGLESRTRTLIRLRYVYGMTWSQVAEQMNYSESQIYRLRREAIEELERKHTHE